MTVLSCSQLLMCGTGDINVQDFKAHAVIVGGSWHFREKVSDLILNVFHPFFKVYHYHGFIQKAWYYQTHLHKCNCTSTR